MANDEDTKLVAVPANAGEIQTYASIDEVDASGFETEQTGFYPYWSPEARCKECNEKIDDKAVSCKKHKDAELIGNRFLATVLHFDEDLQTPEKDRFPRFLLATRAGMAVNTGKRDDGEIVHIKPGDYFNVSKYGRLPLENFISHTVLVTVTGKAPPTNPKYSPAYIFKVQVDPKTKQLLEQERAEYLANAMKMIQERRVAGGLRIGRHTPKALVADGETVSP